jgi:hypothetical protein
VSTESKLHLIILCASMAIATGGPCSSDAHAETYFSLTETRKWKSFNEQVPENCIYEISKEGTDYRREYANGELWTIEDVQLGDRLYVQIMCLWDEGASWSGWSGFHEDSPWIASPAADPNGDGCWGLLDLVYWRREGQWVFDNIVWARRLWGRCLSERGRWE